MSISNILVLIVLANFGLIDNLIQAMTIRGTDIPNLNISQSVGEWYVIGESGVNDDIACLILTITQQSAHNVTLRANITMTSEAIRKNRIIIDPQVYDPLICVIDESSNALISENDYGLVFDVDYDSYMAVYVTLTLEQITTGNNGLIYILGRQQTLPDEIIANVKQSKFYLQCAYGNQQLTNSYSSGCQ